MVSSLTSSTSTVSGAYAHFRSQAEMPRHLVARLRRLAVEHGDTYASYLATQGDREYFWGPGAMGVVAFCRLRRFVVVANGLLVDPQYRESLLADFLAFAEQQHWRVSFVNVPRNEINMFRRHHCQVTKCGEEAVIQLDRTDWRGKSAQWLRRQENYCRRQGVELREVDPDPMDPVYRKEVIPQLEQISRDHIAATLHRREMEFFVSRFSADDLGHRRLFVASQGARIIAFIVCNPGLDGDFWAVEVYRRRPDAVRGVIPALIMHAMRVTKAEGVRYFSLSLVPFLRCTPVVGDSPMLRYVANWWWRHLNLIYDVQGIFHFKSRFRPDYREMFLAVNTGVSVPSLLAMAYLWKLFHFNPVRLLARSLRRRAAEGRLLAVPDRHSRRVIRQLRGRSDRNVAVAQPTTADVVAGHEEHPASHTHEKITV